MFTDTMLGPSRALQQAWQGGVGLLDPQLSESEHRFGAEAGAGALLMSIAVQ